MAIIVICECEAIYEQREIKITDWIEDTADCQICGHELNAWRGNKMLLFDLLKNPTE
jgi:hypothetical protein